MQKSIKKQKTSTANAHCGVTKKKKKKNKKNFLLEYFN